MARSAAAVTVLPYYPSDDEVEELALGHLEDFDAEASSATTEILDHAPEFMSICEQDQMNAHLRDAGRRACVLVIYMQEEDADAFNDEDDDEDVDD